MYVCSSSLAAAVAPSFEGKQAPCMFLLFPLLGLLQAHQPIWFSSRFLFFWYILGPECQNNNFKMILSPVASFSQSFSPFELTATHFGPKTAIFEHPQNTNICYQTLKILIFAPVCIANREICIADTNIYVSKIQIICGKYKFLYLKNI